MPIRREKLPPTRSPQQNVSAKTPGGRDAAGVLESYARLPLAFERNMGQSDAQVKYLSRGNSYEVFLTPKEAVLALWQLPHPNGSPALIRPSDNPKASILRLQLAGANPSPAVEGMSQLDRKVNYFIGNDPKNWIGGVPSYERVEYKSIYPGVDLAFYGQERRLEYDFVVSPGADLKAIALQLVGSQKTHVDSLGNLVVSIPAGEVSFQKPLIYQTGANGERQEIAGGYKIGKDGRVEFAVAEYDRSRTLVIDPVLDYSTYIGGSAAGDSALGVAVDGRAMLSLLAKPSTPHSRSQQVRQQLLVSARPTPGLRRTAGHSSLKSIRLEPRSCISAT